MIVISAYGWRLRDIPIRTQKIYDEFFTDELLEDIMIDTRFHGLITIPAGFRTDFASSPKWAWALVPKRSTYDLATLVHDYLYRTQISTRRDADHEQFHLMKALGVPKWQCQLIYVAVRIGGTKRWNELKAS